MSYFLGPELCLFYNDAYIEIMGAKHPAALAQPLWDNWAETKEEFGSILDRAVKGEFCAFESMQFSLIRHGRPETAYFSYSLVPIFDEGGTVMAVLGPTVEATHHVLAEKQRLAQSERLRNLFEHAPSFMAVLCTPEHRFESANLAFMRLIGLRSVLGKTFAEALPDAVEQNFLTLLDQVFATGKAYNAIAAKYVVQVVPGGPVSECFLDFVYQPMVGADGKVNGIFVEGTDVTDKVLADHELGRVNREQAQMLVQQKETEQRQTFQLALADRIRPLADSDEVVVAASELLGKHLGVARVVYAAVDKSGETVTMDRDWTNGTLPSMAGAVLHLDDFGPLIGQTVRAGWNLIVSDVTTDDRTAAHAQAYAANGVQSFMAIPLMKGKRLRAILSVHHLRSHLWTEHEIALARDMVDRTWGAVESARSQAELRDERDQSQYIFDSMNEGFAVLDANWTVLRVNAEGLRITQRAAHDVIGKNHWDIWPELKGTQLEAMYRQVKETRKADIVEMAYAFPDGRQGWIEVRAHPALNAGMAFFFREITKRKATQEKLQDADRRKDEFLAMLAHELRNPLAPIGAAAELLQMVKLDEERVRQASQIIGRQVAHMTSLVDDLLDVSRVTRGLVELENTPFEIRHIVGDAVEQVTSLIQSRRHHLTLHLPPDTTMVIGDKKRLVQVIANILNNAAKYTQEGGNIELTVEVHAEHIVIEVRDNGIGMSPKLAARAFDLFAQAERTSDRSSGGLGLGLALVKNLVELHHGTVTCESAGLGKGSSFTVCLPRLLANEHSNASQAAASLEQQAHPLRIMVVDDNIDAATMLAMLLEASGHQVLVEHEARRALERAKNEPTQVFLLDIGLPEIDGNELAQQLRAQPETAQSVLIAVTGYGQESDRRKTLAAGFDHHLVKPVDTKKLAAILAGITLM